MSLFGKAFGTGLADLYWSGFFGRNGKRFIVFVEIIVIFFKANLRIEIAETFVFVIDWSGL